MREALPSRAGVAVLLQAFLCAHLGSLTQLCVQLKLGKAGGLALLVDALQHLLLPLCSLFLGFLDVLFDNLALRLYLLLDAG